MVLYSSESISTTLPFCVGRKALESSRRFSPTPGKETLDSIPNCAKIVGLPIPESSRIWGVWRLPVFQNDEDTKIRSQNTKT